MQIARRLPSASRAGLPFACAAVWWLAGCAWLDGSRTAVPSAVPQLAVPDPVGVYEVVLSSGVVVTSGTMEIRGEEGSYTGLLSAGAMAAALRSVEVGPGHMQIEADTGQGIVILRLAADGRFLSGNWVMGERRGTFTAEKR